MPWYPSAKACPAAIKPTVQCFFPTLYQVLFFDFSSFGEKLFFCLRGYAAQSREARCKNSRSAERGCSSVHPPPNRRRMGGGSNLAPHQQAMPRNRAKRDAKNSRSTERGCSSVFPPLNRRRMVGARNPAPPPAGYAEQSRKARCKKQPEHRARLFLCPHAAEQAANGWGPQPCPTTSRLCRAIAQRCTNSSPPQNAARRPIRR